MKTQKIIPTVLRQKAEELHEKIISRNILKVSKADSLKIIHELEVHQIELELQNDELRIAKMVATDLAEKQYKLYDLAPFGYFTISRAGKILEVNVFGAKMLGKQKTNIVNSSFALFITSDSMSIYQTFLNKVLATTSREQCEINLSKKQNPPINIQLFGIASEDGEQCYITAIDITESKRMEDALRTFQKLEALGLLAGGIAYDFNTLMSSISGDVELAIEKIDDESAQLYLAKALSTLDRARNLTGQLLTFAKGGAPSQEVAHLFPFVQEITQLALSGKNIKCEYKISQNLWACKIDKNQIAKVFENLIINATKATADKGNIMLTAINITLSEDEHDILSNGDYVKISIMDSSNGIEKDLLDKIFDPFFTANLTGHGLGLAICYSIVKRHGGCIDVKSYVGLGTTFIIYLPAATDSPATAEEETILVHKGTGTFLIMDSEKVIQEILTTHLNNFGYDVVCKDNGREAVDYYTTETQKGRKFTGLVFGLTVPAFMGGAEALAEIRTFDKDIPAFVISGYDNEPILKDPLDYGFSAIICKPFNKQQLTKMFEDFFKH